MAAKTDFAPYEWKSLLQSPVIAGAAGASCFLGGVFSRRAPSGGQLHSHPCAVPVAGAMISIK